jgi:hypothetical protein
LVANKSGRQGKNEMHKHCTIAFGVMLCLLLAGCGTKYQEMGFTGGVAAEQITKDTPIASSRAEMEILVPLRFRITLC